MFRINRFFYIPCTVFLLLACSDGVDTETPTDTPINTSLTATPKIVESSLTQVISSPDWEGVKNFYSKNPSFNINLEYSLNKSDENKKYISTSKLDYSEAGSVKFLFKGLSWDGTEKEKEKNIEKDTYALWNQFINLIIDNPELFPQTIETISINNQKYDALRFKKIPAYFVLMLMDVFYLGDFETECINPIKNWTLKSKDSPLILTEFLIASGILNDVVTIKNTISSSTVTQRIKKYDDLYTKFKDHLEDSYEWAKNARQKILGKYGGRLKYINTDTRYRGAATHNFEYTYENSYLDTVNIYKEHKKLPILSSNDYLIEVSEEDNAKHYTASNVYYVENALFDTSVTILKDNFIPVELTIESTNHKEYHPRLKISVLDSSEDK